MDEIKILLHAIETLRPDLPALLGDDWPQFEAQLNAYLKQLEESPERSPILRARILVLFGRHRQAHQRLVELMAQFQELEELESLLGRSLGTLSASTPAESPGEREITRYTDIVCPRRVWVNSPRVPVVVRLTVQRSALSAAAEEMILLEHLPVQVVIEAPLFEILNVPRQDIRYPPWKCEARGG